MHGTYTHDRGVIILEASCVMHMSLFLLEAVNRGTVKESYTFIEQQQKSYDHIDCE